VPLPFADCSASVVFSQWVLEYLTLEEAMRTLNDSRRVLTPGGLVRLCQTDIGAITASYLAQGDVGPTPQAAHRARMFLAHAAPDHTQLSARLVRRGGVQQLFDRPKLEWMLIETGFTDIRFVGLHEGQCPDLAELEHEWDPPLIRVEARTHRGGL
jgi:predicted SAM-dependent methyltransferase